MNIPRQTCIIIGASHSGVTCAFALRKEGWEGAIILIDTDPKIPYHRPPLSKSHFTHDEHEPLTLLKPQVLYEKENIDLRLGHTVLHIDRDRKEVMLASGPTIAYDQLVLACGASAALPPIKGLHSAANVFTLRNAEDVQQIKDAYLKSVTKRVVVIGGGYIGLETAASLRKWGAEVTVIERESRLLPRVSSDELSSFFRTLHELHQVRILTDRSVTSIESTSDHCTVICSDSLSIPADIVIVGVGIKVNQELAIDAELAIDDGIVVDGSMRTNDQSIYAIGDCTRHYNIHYDCMIRLESVQNAVDQAKVAAAAICGKDSSYDAIPWFWSDQFETKLQMVGLSQDADQSIVRRELDDPDRLSIWYFQQDQLVAVYAINYAKAYVYGTKLIKSGQTINRDKLSDPNTPLKIENIVS